MKILKKLLRILLLLIVVLLVISFFLPSKYRVERSELIEAKPAAIFEHLNTLTKWPEWTAWTVARYPDMNVSFEGPEAGVGAIYQWSGKSSGNGVLKITRSEPEQGVWFDLDFEQGKYLSKGAILMQPSGDSVKVTWSNEGELGLNPMRRYFGLVMDRMMGPDFEKGLQNLAEKVEGK